jgi:hypothetical protein
MTGFGIMSFGNGYMYCGEWLNHKKHGKGIYKWNDGRAYNGLYEND